MPERSLPIGVASAIAVLIVWSGFIVFSRAGVLSGLTPYDIAAARFLIAGTLTLPFALAWWPRHLPWKAIGILIVAGPGAIYSAFMFNGLAQASAAYGGVFANGALPIFAMILAFFVTQARPRRAEMLGAVVILAGGIMVAWRGLAAGGNDVLTGIALFLCASVFIAVYTYSIRHWSLTPRQALAIVNVPNTLIFLPVWFLFLPSTMADAPMDVVLAQLAFQGLGPGLFAVIAYALLAFHLGPTPTAAVAAAVPASASLLAIPVLGEVPSPFEWLGIGTVTLGLALLTLRR